MGPIHAGAPWFRSPGAGQTWKELAGIAYDAQHDRLFVTGKQWPTIFEIKAVRREQ